MPSTLGPVEGVCWDDNPPGEGEQEAGSSPSEGRGDILLCFRLMASQQPFHVFLSSIATIDL